MSCLRLHALCVRDKGMRWLRIVCRILTNENALDMCSHWKNVNDQFLFLSWCGLRIHQHSEIPWYSAPCETRGHFNVISWPNAPVSHPRGGDLCDVFMLLSLTEVIPWRLPWAMLSSTSISYIEIFNNFFPASATLFEHMHFEWVYMPVRYTYRCCCRIRLWQTKWQNLQSAKYYWWISQHGCLKARCLIYQGDNTVE